MIPVAVGQQSSIEDLWLLRGELGNSLPVQPGHSPLGCSRGECVSPWPGVMDPDRSLLPSQLRGRSEGLLPPGV